MIKIQFPGEEFLVDNKDTTRPRSLRHLIGEQGGVRFVWEARLAVLPEHWLFIGMPRGPYFEEKIGFSLNPEGIRLGKLGLAYKVSQAADGAQQDFKAKQRELDNLGPYVEVGQTSLQIMTRQVMTERLEDAKKLLEQLELVAQCLLAYKGSVLVHQPKLVFQETAGQVDNQTSSLPVGV
jgi:hypothetical protein